MCVLTGTRPGKNTSDKIRHHLNRTTLFGAMYTGLIFLMYKFFTLYSWHPRNVSGISIFYMCKCSYNNLI